jgi:tripartite-type tricarboxylate transporter receptor subunit TctC
MRTPFWTATCRLAGALSIVLASTGARADAVSDFYGGRTITVVIASGAGGGYDFFGRALAKYIGRFLPGHPNAIVQNMPGAGGTKMANYAYNVAPQDGTMIGVPLAPTPMVQVLTPKGIKYDATKFHWIGNIEQSVGILFTFRNSATKTIADAMKRVTPMAGSGKNSATYQTPVLCNALLGTKFKVVLGYGGAAQMELAIEKGEVDGRMGVWQTLKTTQPGWISDHKVNFLAVSALERGKQLPDTPTFIELAKTDEARKIFEFMALQNLTGRAVFAPPGTPADRVAALRRAFDKAVVDPGMLTDMAKAGMEIEATPGEEVQKAVDRLIATPPQIVARMQSILDQK